MRTLEAGWEYALNRFTDFIGIKIKYTTSSDSVGSLNFNGNPKVSCVTIHSVIIRVQW